MTTELQAPDAPKRIWLFEDELRTGERYQEAIQAVGLHTRLFGSADAVLEATDRSPLPDGVVLDVMAPTGTRLSAAETRNGGRTGLRLYQELKDRGYANPAFFLTNLPEWTVRSELPEGDPAVVMEKIHYMPRHVAQMVKNAIAPKPKFEERLNRFWDLPDGWHGPGSLAVGFLPMSRALEFLRPIVGTSCREPEVFPTPSGGVQCEWYNKDRRRLILEWQADGTVQWWCGLPGEPREEGVSGSDGIVLDTIRADLQRVGAWMGPEGLQSVGE